MKDWLLKVNANTSVIGVDTPFTDGVYTGGAGAFDSLDESALYYVNEGKFEEFELLLINGI